MSVRSITISASSSGFRAAAAWLEDYAETLKEKASKVLDAMLKEGEFTAKVLLVHIDTGETLNSIMGYREGDHGIISVGGKAIWIEFGTGVYAPGQVDYPVSVEGIVPHGTYGEGHGADPNGWYYTNINGEVRHTLGIAANMFMYNTAQRLRREYKRIAHEVFG